MRFTTGTYTGDGAATLVITGVGFQPRFVFIVLQSDFEQDQIFFKSDQDGLYAKQIFTSDLRWDVDVIISLDADGFTIGDGSTSINLVNCVDLVYAFMCWG